jgi:hypothetical protein
MCFEVFRRKEIRMCPVNTHKSLLPTAQHVSLPCQLLHLLQLLLVLRLQLHHLLLLLLLLLLSGAACAVAAAAFAASATPLPLAAGSHSA